MLLQWESVHGKSTLFDESVSERRAAEIANMDMFVARDALEFYPKALAVNLNY